MGAGSFPELHREAPGSRSWTGTRWTVRWHASTPSTRPIETSLLALQDHAGRRLLEGAELTGVTKERWAATEQSISLLWAYFDAYTGGA